MCFCIVAATPFFYERSVEEEWLSSDWGYCAAWATVLCLVFEWRECWGCRSLSSFCHFCPMCSSGVAQCKIWQMTVQSTSTLVTKTTSKWKNRAVRFWLQHALVQNFLGVAPPESRTPPPNLAWSPESRVRTSQVRTYVSYLQHVLSALLCFRVFGWF